MPFHARSGRNYIPVDIAGRAGLEPADYSAGQRSPALRAAVAEIAAAAARHLKMARAQKGAVPRSAVAAVLPAVIAERYLKKLRRAGYDPFAPQLALPDPLQAWRLLAASLLRRY
jgi:phytoene synthase